MHSMTYILLSFPNGSLGTRDVPGPVARRAVCYLKTFASTFFMYSMLSRARASGPGL